MDNYQYDDIGNLNKDTQEDIENIEWTVYGKVKAVNRVSDPATKLPLGNKPNLVFEYDASGNRVVKISIAKYGKVSKTYYIRDASGNVMSTYESPGTSSLKLGEQYLYGSSRLGVLENGSRSYELTDHLGNVRAVVGDDAVVRSATDYYPFGMAANAYSPNSYRYGFNRQEREAGFNDNYDFGARIFDQRIARFLSIDPLANYFVDFSPYCYANNSPIFYVDALGMKPIPYSKEIQEGLNKKEKWAYTAAVKFDINNNQVSFKRMDALEVHSSNTFNFYHLHRVTSFYRENAKKEGQGVQRGGEKENWKQCSPALSFAKNR